jgi:hypothetical protein
MPVGWKRCHHEWRVAKGWIDSGGGHWREDECRNCGLLERYRIESPAQIAAAQEAARAALDELRERKAAVA